MTASRGRFRTARAQRTVHPPSAITRANNLCLPKGLTPPPTHTSAPLWPPLPVSSDCTKCFLPVRVARAHNWASTELGAAPPTAERQSANRAELRGVLDAMPHTKT